jgi:hypothetical protein
MNFIKEIWTNERKVNEAAYRVEFKKRTRQLVMESLKRMEVLLDTTKNEYIDQMRFAYRQ